MEIGGFLNNDLTEVMDEITLILVCKRPVMGVGKQRLVVHFGLEKTLRIAQALLNCALEDAVSWDGPVVIAPASYQDHDWAASLLPLSKKVKIQPQTRGNLGQRLNELDRTLREDGLKKLIFIGSDAPSLTVSDYEACRHALQRHDTVFIPASDGGVALMASRYPWPELAELPWSTDRLGVALADCCRRTGRSVVLLEQRSDVDEMADCLRLVALLRNDERSARQQLYTLVREFIDKTEIEAC